MIKSKTYEKIGRDATAKLISKIRDAVSDMYDKVIFDEKSHTYQLKETGEWLQGVSSVSSIVPKDWLSAWGAKEVVKALGYSDYEGDTKLAAKVMRKIAKIKTPEEFILFLKDAKGASKRKSKKALVDGTAGHALLEKYVLYKMGKGENPKATGNLRRPFAQFKKWAKQDVEYWLLSEARVAYPEKKYAGTLDALAMMKTGHLAVIDYKFATHISEDYTLQTSGYQATFEPYGIKIDKRIIVRLPKTLLREEWDEKTHRYSKVKNDLEVKVVDTDYEEDRDVFFACLPVKKWINKVTKQK